MEPGQISAQGPVPFVTQVLPLADTPPLPQFICDFKGMEVLVFGRNGGVQGDLPFFSAFFCSISREPEEGGQRFFCSRWQRLQSHLRGSSLEPFPFSEVAL